MTRQLSKSASVAAALLTAGFLAVACTGGGGPLGPGNGDPASRYAGFDEVLVVERGGSQARGAPQPAALTTQDGQGNVVPLPLKRTDVRGDISLQIGSVTVTQGYHNPYDTKIEAVYTFPLPQDAAISDFVMQIGDRRIRGIIRPKSEARRIYEEARGAGLRASLMTQERPNVFTQSVANIEPGKAIDVEVSYFQQLRYDRGGFELVIPTVVGPRFNPPGHTDGIGAVPRGGAASGQPRDIPYLRPGEAGANRISVDLRIDAGVALGAVTSASHRIEVERLGATAARVRLAVGDREPNRDLVVRYEVAADDLRAAVATSASAGREYFALFIQPPAEAEGVDGTPVEMTFVLDCSGSMDGAPFESCRGFVRRALARLGPNDAFRLIRFADVPSALGPDALPADRRNVRRALDHLDGLRPGGGTMMMHGIRAALQRTPGSERRRIVVFMTDGYIGNERDVLAEVQRGVGDARIFSLGAGAAPNRYLLERMADLGRGVAAYLAGAPAGEVADEVVDAVFARLRQPVLSDLELDWGGAEVEQLYPARLPDVFVGRPLLLVGRLKAGTHVDRVRVRGRCGAEPREIVLPGTIRTENPALPKVWARARIRDLNDRALGGHAGELRSLVQATALEHGLMSAFTSFVAVDASGRTAGAEGVTVPVAVPVPQGTRYETTVGEATAGQGK